MEHKLKIRAEYFNAVKEEVKKFEIRKNDRGYAVGDRVHLYEFENEKYTGRAITKVITYITDYEQKEGFVVMGIENEVDKQKECRVERGNTSDAKQLSL